MTNTPEPDALRVLRSGTQDLHQQLEAVPAFAVLMQDSVTLGDYAFMLAGLLRSYATFEPQLIGALHQHLPDHPYLPRMPLLLRDLAQLDAAPLTSTESPAQAGKVPSLAATLGMLYVVEGSTLGGQVLSRHLSERLGPGVENKLAFYSLDATLSRQHWANIQRVLRQHLSSPSLTAEALQAARQIFGNFIQHCQR